MGAHYENMPMQYTEIFIAMKKRRFSAEKFWYFSYFAQNIDCGYTLELPHRGGPIENSQSMFWSKNKKTRYTPANPSFSIQVGVHVLMGACALIRMNYGYINPQTIAFLHKKCLIVLIL